MWCLVCGVRCVVCGMVCGVCCVVWCVVCGVTLHFHKSHGISAHYIDLGFENQAVTVSEFVWEGSIQHNAGGFDISLSGFVDASCFQRF